MSAIVHIALGLCLLGTMRLPPALEGWRAGDDRDVVRRAAPRRAQGKRTATKKTKGTGRP